MAFRDDHVVSLGRSGDHLGEQAGYEAAEALLATPSPPDGIFCFNDPSAMGAMRAILDAGLDIPRDIAVVGCGNVSYTDFLRVPLSTIDQGRDLIGSAVASLAVSLAARRSSSSERQFEFVVPRLVVRTSSLRLPSGRGTP